jgi:predicted ATPase/DNA-binding SARP family transcriptional activator
MAEFLDLPKPRQRSKPVPVAELPHAFPHNLPPQPTPFIGREQELSEIESLLSDPSCRLLTLVGPGGIGKTRLALEAASQQLGDYSNGVWFVPFVGVSSPEHIVPTLADSLKFSFYGPADPKVQILNYLKEKKMLLVLDNFEHLLNGAGLVSEILGTAPEVKCLVTSRELLKLKEEWAFQVKGLEYPKDEKSEEAVEDYSAVQLFLQGAKRSDTSFRLSQEDKPFVVQVCQGVEGMPLGIELASSWVRALSLKEIAKEVSKSLGFFATGQRDLAERHRSLGGVFENSYSMLTREEQRAFRRMSVFRGGFGREAGEKVAGATLPVIARLIDKSFIRKAPSGRYEVHELMRQFGEGKLKDVAGEKRKIQGYLAEYYAEFLHEREETLHGERQKEVLGEIGGEIDNIRVGWGWALEQGDIKVLERGESGLATFYQRQGLALEGQETFAKAAEKLHSRYGRLRIFGMLLAHQGYFFSLLGDLERAKKLLEKALPIIRRQGDSKGVADSLVYLGEVLWTIGEHNKVFPLLEESIGIYERIGDKPGKAWVFMFLGLEWFMKGSTRKGESYFSEGLRLQRELQNSWGISNCLHNYGCLLFYSGRISEATQMLKESQAISRNIGDRVEQVMALHCLSLPAIVKGHYEEAEQYLNESLALAGEVGDRRSIGWILGIKGFIALLQNEFGVAERFLRDGLERLKEVGDQDLFGVCLCYLGRVSEARGEHAEAKRLYRECLAPPFGTRPETIEALKGLGDIACTLGDFGEAEQWFRKALRRAVGCGYLLYIQDVLVSFAALFAKQREKEKALELCALVLRQPVCIKETQVRAEKLFSELKAELPAKVVALVKKRGEAKSVEDAVEEILGERVVPAGEEKLRVLLLGVPKVLFGDREISDKAWGLKRAKKLFCYLALLGGKGLPRDEVIEAFWPKAGPKKGLDSLYSSLTAIRKALKAEAGVEGQVVSLEEGRCGLDPKVEVYLDVKEFESLLKKGKQKKEEDQKKATQKALTLVRGRFCEGWYDSWVVEAERSVSEKHLEALKAFGMACLQDEKLEESIQCLEKALALDNLHEETCRNLMTAYARAGRKKALLETYANLKTRLKKELGAEPEPKTVELYEKLIK